MIAVFKKELWAYFGNWSAWVIIASFSLLGSLFLFFFENNFNFFDIGAASMQTYFVLVPWLFMFIIPALSMKTLAEEQQSGTLGWLFSQPLKLTEIIGGKFLSVWLIGVLCLLPSIVYFNTISTLSRRKYRFWDDFGWICRIVAAYRSIHSGWDFGISLII